MTEETTLPTSWEDVIIDFFETKVANLKSGMPCKIYKANKYLKEKKSDLINEKDQKKRSRIEDVIEKKTAEYKQLHACVLTSEVNDWIGFNFSKKISVGKRITESTHVNKFSYDSAHVGGFIDTIKSIKTLITTDSLKHRTLDMAHHDGALITITRFLALRYDGRSILNCITEDDFSFLKAASKNKAQLKEWSEGFKELIEVRNDLHTDKLKQTYFRVSDSSIDSERYKILVPVYASSLSHGLFCKYNNIKFGQESKAANKALYSKDEATYSTYPSRKIQNMAHLKFGGSNPQNISMLNVERNGKGELLSCHPPVWKGTLKAPSSRSIFESDYAYLNTTRNCLNILASYVVGYEISGLSQKHPDKYVKLDHLVNQLMDGLTNYILSIRELSPGWTSNSRLKLAHQYILDPNRGDEAYQSAREKEPYEKVILQDFASWINHELCRRDKRLNLGEDQSRVWISMTKENLRQFIELTA